MEFSRGVRLQQQSQTAGPVDSRSRDNTDQTASGAYLAWRRGTTTAKAAATVACVGGVIHDKRSSKFNRTSHNGRNLLFYNM